MLELICIGAACYLLCRKPKKREGEKRNGRLTDPPIAYRTYSFGGPRVIRKPY